MKRITIIILISSILAAMGVYIYYAYSAPHTQKENSIITNNPSVQNSQSSAQEQSSSSSKSINSSQATKAVRDSSVYRFLGGPIQDLGSGNFLVRIRQKITGEPPTPSPITLNVTGCKTITLEGIYDIYATYDVVTHTYICTNALHFPFQSGGDQ